MSGESELRRSIKVPITPKIFWARNKSLYRTGQDCAIFFFFHLVETSIFCEFSKSFLSLHDRVKQRLGLVTSFQDSAIRSRPIASTGSCVNICFIVLTKSALKDGIK